jgi:hypothetical protein
MKVAELEQSFQSYVLARTPGVARVVAADGKAGAEERLGVYFDAYRLRLLEVLENDYPALRATAGAAEFDRIGRAYIDAHPSDTPSVRWFGRHLAAFLKASKARPAFADLAAFEWAQGEVFDAADAPSAGLDAMSKIPGDAWGGMRLEFHPAVRRVDLWWNAPAIAQAVDEKKKKRPKPARGAKLQPWLLWRRALEIRWRSLGADEAAAIDAAREGETFADVCERLCEWIAPDRAALHAASLLKRWLADGLITAVRA